MHNRKLLALAVAGTLGVPIAAYADTANVNVYGKLYPQFQVQSAHGATVATETPSTLAAANTGVNGVSHQLVQSQNSNIGFKGEADVGGGMKGWFQVEQEVNLETNGGTWSSRNSAAGISGAFGNVFLGNWDTVYKQLGDPVSFLGISSGNFISTSNVLSKTWSGKGSFHLRQPNNLEYDSPTIGGATVMVEYSPDEAKTYSSDAYLYDVAVKWESGPLYVALARETHNDFFGGSLSATAGFRNTAAAGDRSKDTGTRFSAMYTFGGTQVGIDVAEMEYRETGPRTGAKFDQYKHRAVSLVATQKLGSLQLAGSLVRADKGTCKLSDGSQCTTDGLDGTEINLGAKYDFSKRVSVYGIVSRINNGKSAQYNSLATTGTTVNPGADPEAGAVGVVVSF